MPKIKNKDYFLNFHNGEKINKLKIKFEKNTSIIKNIKLDNLAYGVNIFTLVDDQNNPIAERLFFNYEGLPLLDFNKTSVKTVKDSLEVYLKFDDKINFKNSNASISILPKRTKSYNKSSNIISQTLLNPYLKGIVENGGYYFKNINDQKKYDLDNLLITQGWSSFDWKSITDKEQK